MTLTVKERAETIATFRFIEVYLMETLARWTPTTPEMEVKVLFGRHIWETAQHADALGKRTYELRAPMHFTQKPAAGYVDFLAGVAALTDTRDRIAGLYDIALPGLARRYGSFVSETDRLLDAPSVKVIERVLADIEVMRKEADRLREELPSLASHRDLGSLRQTEADMRTMVIHNVRPAAQGATA